MNTRDASSSSSSLTRTDIRKMKVVDLKKQLKARNLDDTGLRNDLMQRLLDHLDDTTILSPPNKVKSESISKQNKKEKYISPEMQYVLRYSGLSIHGNAQGSCGLILYNSDTEKEVWSGYMFFQNGESAPEAEMKALLITIRNLLKLGVKHLIIQGYAPSAVLNQLQGNFGVKSKDLKVLYDKLQPLMKEFDSCEVWGIPQDQLRKAQRLAKKAIQGKTSTGFCDLMSDDNTNNTISTDIVEDGHHSFHTEPLDVGDTVNEEENNITWAPLPSLSPNKEYIMRFDGGSRGNPGNAGAGMAVFDPESGLEQWCAYKWLESTTNNVAEYEGLIIGLQMAKDMGARRLLCEGDSTLIIKQVTGEWACKKDHLKPFHQKVKELMKDFDSIKFQYIPRADNARADELANIAMDRRSSSGVDVVDSQMTPLTNKASGSISEEDKDALLEAFLLNLPEPQLRETVDSKKLYTLRFTGGSKSGCYVSVAEIVDSFTNEKKWNGVYFTHDEACTQVIAQYCGLIIGLRKASAMGIKRLLVDSPSQVVIRQLNGKYGVKNNGMKICHKMVRELCKNFDEIDFSDEETDGYSNMNIKTLYHIAMQEKETLLGDY